MRPRISFITLGVDDLERAVAFYRDGLGLPTRGIIGTEFEHGAVLPVTGPAPTNACLAHNVHTRDAVDALMRQAEAAGATLVKPAHDTFYGGYAGYFQDPDGHLWEIAWNPKMMPPD